MSDVFSTLGVDWPPFLAQVILFIIVYFILSKLAFGPIIAMLEERKKRIEEGMLNAEKIRKQLADSEKHYQEILAKANADAQKLIDEARSSSSAIAERRQQQAITDAEQIIAKAREATALEHDRILSELKLEVGRLVVDTTVKVTGKVLTTDDQKRLSDEAARQIAA